MPTAQQSSRSTGSNTTLAGLYFSMATLREDCSDIVRNASLFLWLDLREFLPPSLDGWEAESLLAEKLVDHGVYLAPGVDYLSEVPGYFRVVFSMVNVELGLQR